MCKNVIEAIGAYFQGTKLHYYSNAGVTNTGQEPLSPNWTCTCWFGLWCLTPLIKRNISVILWRSILLVEEIRVPGENHRPAASHGETLTYDVVLSTLHLSEIRTHNVSGDKQLGTDCKGSC
jgi:hypothetical protein